MMNERIDRLRKVYPKMYDKAYDVYVGPGWMTIVETLTDSIQAHIDRVNRYMENNRDKFKYPEMYQPIEQVVVEQIKEKFGGLRFYYNGGDSYIAGMVDLAEHWAEKTCEECGKPGHLRNDLSWIKTLCDEHYVIKKHDTNR